MFANLRRGLPGYVSSAIDSLIAADVPGRFRWLENLWLLGLFCGGLLVFGYYFNWGNFDMLYHDWAQITGPRLQFLQTAIQQGVLPLQISDSETFHFATTRYLAVADAFISPQYLLLKWLSLPVFSMVNVGILYSLGFAGMLVVKRKLHLSPVVFTVAFLLFNFNGSVLAHYSVGHTTWGGYFLFPWFVWLVVRLLDGDRSWLWTTLTALLLFTMWLQGSYHQFVWLLLLLAAIGISVPRTFLTILRTGIATLVVSAFRLLPCILAYTNYKQVFLNGYPSLFSIWDNLVNLPNWLYTPFYVNQNLGTPLGEWELTVFIGLLGGIFLVYFGIYKGLIHPRGPYNRLLLPISFLSVLSLGPVFQLLLKLPIPLIQGERVSARIFSVVLIFGIILGAERMQRLLDGIPNKLLAVGGCLVGLVMTGVELWQDFLVWRISNRNQDFWIYFNPSKWFPVTNTSDTLYIGLVFGGMAISIVSIALLGWLSWREHRMTAVHSS